jgi:hypothetical protein
MDSISSDDMLMGQSKSSSDRYEFGSEPKACWHDLYGLGSQFELLLLRRIARDSCCCEEVDDVCECVLEVVLSDLVRVCGTDQEELGDALSNAV